MLALSDFLYFEFLKEIKEKKQKKGTGIEQHKCFMKKRIYVKNKSNLLWA